MADILYPDLSGNGKGVLDIAGPIGTQGGVGATGLGAVQGASGIINVNKRGEYYAMGWNGVTTKESYTLSTIQNEQFSPEYYTTLRGQKNSVTTDGTPYPRYGFTFLVQHNMVVGDRIEVTGASDAGYNGTRSVYSVVDEFTIQVDYGGAVLGSSAGIKVAAYGAVINSTDEAIRYSFPRETATFAGTLNWTRNGIQIRDAVRSYDLGGGRFSYEFLCLSDTMELIFYSAGSFEVWVDGSALSIAPFTMSGGYPLTYNKFQFTGKRVRHIRVQVEGTNAVGVAVRTRSDILPVTGPRRLRVATLSDSFGENTGASAPKFGFLAQLCRRQDWDLYNLSVGGTGINTDGGGAFGKKKYIDRIYELVAADPDIVILDNSLNSTPGLTRADCDAVITAIRTCVPHARIIGFGRRHPNYLPTTTTLNDDVTFRAACVANSISFLDGGIGAHGLPQWLTLANQNTYYNGVQAALTAVLTANALTLVTVNNAGDGYDFFKTYPITITGGGGAGATVTPNWNSEVTAVQVLAGGFGYTVAPTVVIECGATAISNRNATTTLTDITVTNGGGSYVTTPIVTITGGGGGIGAAATAIISNGRVVGVTVTAGGTGYTSDPTITISESTTKATGTVVISGGKVTSINITSAGSFYKSIPRIRFVPDASGGQGAIAVAHVSNKLSSVTVTAGGAGYTSLPTISIGHPTNNDVTHPKSMGHMMLAERYGIQLDSI